MARSSSARTRRIGAIAAALPVALLALVTQAPPAAAATNHRWSSWQKCEVNAARDFKVRVEWHEFTSNGLWYVLPEAMQFKVNSGLGAVKDVGFVNSVFGGGTQPATSEYDAIPTPNSSAAVSYYEPGFRRIRKASDVWLRVELKGTNKANLCTTWVYVG